jgi:hypothetical protein
MKYRRICLYIQDSKWRWVIPSAGLEILRLWMQGVGGNVEQKAVDSLPG